MQLRFRDHNGKKILIEKPTGGRSFQSAIFDGKRYYHLTQTFQTTDDDAWYGLGPAPGWHHELQGTAGYFLSKQYGSSHSIFDFQ